MKYFFDTSISHRIVEALHVLRRELFDGKSDIIILHLTQKFKNTVDDYDWLNTLVLEGDWVVISADTRIFSNPLQRRIWRSRNIIVFVLEKGWRGQKLWDRAWRIIRVWPEIIRSADKSRPGSCYKISVNCKIIQLT